MRHGVDDATRLIKAIRRIAHAIDLRSRKVSRAVGLTIPQIVVLSSVRDMGEVTTRAISQASDLSPATVVTILDKLEERGLVERYRSRIDRRIVHTRLTAKGAVTLASAPPLLDDAFRAGLAGLPGEDRARLVAALETVAEMMDVREIDAETMLTPTGDPT